MKNSIKSLLGLISVCVLSLICTQEPAPAAGGDFPMRCEDFVFGHQHGLVLHEMPGRMANNMIQVAWVATRALELGTNWTFRAVSSHFEQKYSVVQDILAQGGNVSEWIDVRKHPSYRKGCSWDPHDEFFQNYEWLRLHRTTLNCLFHDGDLRTKLAPNDVVIHFRSIYLEERRKFRFLNEDPPTQFYLDSPRMINASLRASGGIGTTWVIVDPGMERHDEFRVWIKEVGGKIHGGSAVEDHSVARKAANLVTSMGTYSWTASFLSEAQSIHMPYCSERPSKWVPWHSLFIEDDPRIFWHDFCGSISGSGKTVLKGNTWFAGVVHQRISGAKTCLPRPSLKTIANHQFTTGEISRPAASELKFQPQFRLCGCRPGIWERDFIFDLLNIDIDPASGSTSPHCPPDCRNLSKPANVLVADLHGHDPNFWLPEINAMDRPLVLFHISDERCVTSADLVTRIYSRFKLVVRHYACHKQLGSVLATFNHVIIAPLGYNVSFTGGEPSLKTIARQNNGHMRQFRWSFQGTVKTNRAEGIRDLSDITPYHVGTSSVDKTELFRIYSRSSFVMSGRSNDNLDCLGHSEATVAGAIPVVIGSNVEIADTFMHFGSGRLPPWLFAETWQQAKAEMKAVLSNQTRLKQMQAENSEWRNSEILRI